MIDATGVENDRSDGRSRLLLAATELIARHGPQAATVRRVAEAAGVSAPLVLHHFGSKQGLIDACDAHVRDVVDQAIAKVASGGGEGVLRDTLGDPEAAVALMYIGRALQDDTTAARTWFDGLYAQARAGMDDMQSTGVMRPVDDPPMAALLMLAMDLGMVFLRRHVERTLGGRLDDPAITARWVAAEFDIFTHALLPQLSTETT